MGRRLMEEETTYICDECGFNTKDLKEFYKHLREHPVLTAGN